MEKEMLEALLFVEQARLRAYKKFVFNLEFGLQARICEYVIEDLRAKIKKLK